MICMVCMIAPKDGFLQTMHSRKIMQIMHFMPSAPLPTRKQTVKKVPTGRHARTVGTHTGKLSAESVRAALRRVRGSALNFVPRGIPGGRNFCPAYAGRNGFPLERVASRHAKKTPEVHTSGVSFARSRHLPIFTGRVQPTIFGTSELNFCVRNGNRWGLTVIDTGRPEYVNQLALLFSRTSLYFVLEGRAFRTE